MLLASYLLLYGFLLTQGYARINENLTVLNKEIVDLKIQVTSIQNQLLDEARIKEIVETELLKHGIK